jgi:hypothetical protein
MIFLSRIDYLPACKLVNGDEGEESELEEDAESYTCFPLFHQEVI